MNQTKKLSSNEAEAIDNLRSDSSLHALGLVVTGVLGEGGTAIVYRARDARHERNVAVKVLRPDIPPSAARRFAQEVLVAGRLRHAHMLPLFDSGRLADGRLFSIMPVAEGRPLSALIREGPLPIADAVRIARETAEALGFMHRNGFVHRDVKPENILVESGHAVLTDFGLAIAHGSQDVNDVEDQTGVRLEACWEHQSYTIGKHRRNPSLHEPRSVDVQCLD